MHLLPLSYFLHISVLGSDIFDGACLLVPCDLGERCPEALDVVRVADGRWVPMIPVGLLRTARNRLVNTGLQLADELEKSIPLRIS